MVHGVFGLGWLKVKGGLAKVSQVAQSVCVNQHVPDVPMPSAQECGCVVHGLVGFKVGIG